MRRRLRLRRRGRLRLPVLLGEQTLMFILMAVGAEQLPVAPIRRIIVMIVVAVMHFQQLEIAMGELAGASSAYPGIDLECLLAIPLGALLTRAPRFSDDSIESRVTGCCFAIGHDGCLCLCWLH